jgi:hypothetical protein
MIQRFVMLAAAALCFAFAAGESAASQTPAPTPSPIDLPTLGPSQPLNPYLKMGLDLLNGLMQRQHAKSQNEADGQVTYYRRFDLQVQIGPNSYRDVHLHQGTIINPRGISLAPGQRVNVGGHGLPDGSLDANVITVLE